MQLSKQDTFCEAQASTTSEAASTNVLDFGKHGDDVLGKLFWSLYVASTDGTVDKTLTVKWQTCDAEGFASNVETLRTEIIPAAKLTAGAYPLKNLPLPKGLKRYNRLTLQSGGSSTYYPSVTAFIHDGRDEGTPFKGL